jgi:hypothetical protein
MTLIEAKQILGNRALVVLKQRNIEQENIFFLRL